MIENSWFRKMENCKQCSNSALCIKLNFVRINVNSAFSKISRIFLGRCERKLHFGNISLDTMQLLTSIGDQLWIEIPTKVYYCEARIPKRNGPRNPDFKVGCSLRWACPAFQSWSGSTLVAAKRPSWILIRCDLRKISCSECKFR